MPSTHLDSSFLIPQYDGQHPLASFDAENAMHFKNKLIDFRNSLLSGDSIKTQDSLFELTHSFGINPFEVFTNSQDFLKYINIFCQLSLLTTDVHPTYIFHLYGVFYQKINTLDNIEHAITLSNEICHKYCLLIKNYSLSAYSRHIRTIISYIHLHIEEDLSLKRLAELVNKNPSALSRSFSTEVGMTITEYIHRTRIDKALFYFNTTQMSISEVALAVGMHDFSYFSRVFHQQVGCSPRDYRKQL